MRIDELIDGFVEVEAEKVEAAEEEEDTSDSAEDEDTEEDDEEASAKLAAANLAQLKVEALAQFDYIRKAYKKAQAAHVKYGLGSPQHMKAQSEVTEFADGNPLHGSPGGQPVRKNPQRGGRSPLARAQDHGVLRGPLRHATPGTSSRIPSATKPIWPGWTRKLPPRKPIARRSPRFSTKSRRTRKALIAMQDRVRPADQRAPQDVNKTDVHRRSQGPSRQA